MATAYPGVETADIIPVASTDAEYEYWRSQILANAAEICKRTFVPATENKDGLAYEGVKVDHVRETIAQYQSEKHYLYVAATRTATRNQKYGRCRQLHAFAIAKEAKDHLYLDVVCAREPISQSDKRLKWGGHLLNNFEAHARRLGKQYVLLCSLNLWLVENYYAPRGYVERDLPWQKKDARKPTYSLNPGPQEIRGRAKLLEAAKEHHVEKPDRLTDQEIREKLEARTWCGFRMSRGLTDVALTPAKHGAPLLRHNSGSSHGGTPGRTPKRSLTPSASPRKRPAT